MLFLIKLFPEITIKSRPVRRRFNRQLRKNIKSVLRAIDPAIQVRGEWDVIEVESELDAETERALMLERLTCTPGISSIIEVDKHPLPDFEGMLDLALTHYKDLLQGKTFAVRCKRTGRHAFQSVDVERFVGARLNQQTEAAGVRLVNPQVTVALEIRQDNFFDVRAQHTGLGGYPLGCQDNIVSLISGGFDSAVSSYLCIRRGIQTHYCFFKLGGKAHELAVKEVALYLWMKYHTSHRVKFISVPFEGVVEEILNKVDNSQMGVVLKRMMMRAADSVARQLNIKAVVTGESVAQVSSQTLANLAVIDSVADSLVLRPLSTTDKQEIIDMAREIGTEEFSRNIPEYCAVISNKPTTKAKPERIAAEEAKFDFAVLDAAIESASYQLITEVSEDFAESAVEVRVVNQIEDKHTIIDIRHPAEQGLKPLQINGVAGVEVLEIPFYALRTRFSELNPDGHFLLYCDRGMMSRLHAAHLRDEGFENVAVLEFKDLP